MALLNDEIVQNVTEMLADLANEVKLVVFTTDKDCEFCPQIVQLVEEVAATSAKVTVETHKFEEAQEQAAALNITMAPAIAILGAKDYGLRFYGIPSGYEFSTLLHAIQKVSAGAGELDAPTRAFLDGLSEPVHLQVFVTPTCPYCPPAATLAYEMALASDLVRAEVIESMEFQALAGQFNVMGVPLNVINGKERVEGAAPSARIVTAIQAALA